MSSVWFHLSFGICSLVVVLISVGCAWVLARLTGSEAGTFFSVLLAFAATFVVYCRLVLTPISGAVDDDPRGVLDTWSYSKTSLLRIMMAIVAIASVSAATKTAVLVMASGFAFDLIATAVIFVGFLLQAYHPGLIIMVSEIPTWMVVVDILITCLAIAAIVGALTRIHRAS